GSPEGKSVIRIGHVSDVMRKIPAWSIALQIQNDVDSGLMQQSDVARHFVLVLGPAIAGGHPIDVEPTILIEGHPIGIDDTTPTLDGLHRGRIAGPVKESPTTNTSVFAAHSVDAAQLNGRPAAVHQLAP